jgi:hypothetical protein
MGTNPTPSVTLLAQELTNAWTLAYTALNNAAVAAYTKGVAAAEALGQPLPTPPMQTIVNGNVVLQLEEQENANPGSTTGAQWAAALYTYQYIPTTPPPAPLRLYSLGAIVAPGMYVLTTTGAWPADGAEIEINGSNYIAHQATGIEGLFGTWYAQAVS